MKNMPVMHASLLALALALAFRTGLAQEPGSCGVVGGEDDEPGAHGTVATVRAASHAGNPSANADQRSAHERPRVESGAGSDGRTDQHHVQVGA